MYFYLCPRNPVPRCLLNIKKNLCTQTHASLVQKSCHKIFLQCIISGKAWLPANRRTSRRTIYPCCRKSAAITGNEPQGTIVMCTNPRSIQRDFRDTQGGPYSFSFIIWKVVLTLLYVYECFSLMFVCAPHVCSIQRGWRRASDPLKMESIIDTYERPCGCRDLNQGPLQEQAVSLTTGQSPQAHIYVI